MLPSKEGFDIVIGNPPYGAKYDSQTKQFYKDTYVTAKSIRGLQKGSLDTYTLFIELGYNLLRRNGSFAYIVPISLTSRDSFTEIHRMLMGNCDTIHISSYAARPKPVFENATDCYFRKQKRHVSICILQRYTGGEMSLIYRNLLIICNLLT